MYIDRMLLENIVQSFIDDFNAMNGLADSFRYTAIQGIVRYAFMCKQIDEETRDLYLVMIRKCVGNFFGENIVDAFYFSL